jgi:hypothetical protein
MDTNESERLARLEREIVILRTDLARMREYVGAPAGEGRSADPSPSRPVVELPIDPPPRPKSFELFPPRGAAGPSVEELIGRYGTIAVATVTVLIGVGIFLNWAIKHGLLGPTMRIVLGYAIALAIAAVGARLRLRGTREFGNVLLAIALGVVHLVCWYAGPVLHVLPSWVALAFGFVASAGLAEFALRHDEEMLCAVGFGGAALAPFITSDSDGNHVALAAYGLAVVGLGAAALGDRVWRVARGVTIASLVVYTIVTGSGLPSLSPPAWVAMRLYVLFPLIALLAIIPFGHALHRRTLIRWAGASLVIGGFLRADERGVDLWAAGFLVLGTIVTIGALNLTRPGALEEALDPDREKPFLLRGVIIDALLLPIGLFIATIAATPSLPSWWSAGVATLYALLAIWMTHRTRGDPHADPYAGAASLIALWIVPAAFLDHDLARVAASAALGIVLMRTALTMDRLPFAAGAVAALTIASAWALVAASARTQYEYLPFMTIETLGCAVAVVGWIVVLRIVRPTELFPSLSAETRTMLCATMVIAAAATAFFWGVAELHGAWNKTASTSLLIVYYAAAGTLMIWLGRIRAIQPLRVIGLGVTLWGAKTALGEAFGIPNVAVRVTVFFAVSAFLIAVGYWYRRGAESEPLAPVPA